jgi:hypothetical protein
VYTCLPVSRAVYTPYRNNVVPTVIPSFLSCNRDPSLFGCKNCVCPEEDGGGQPGLTPISRRLASLACGWAGEYICRFIMLYSDLVATYWSVGRGHGIFYLVMCCIIIRS